MSTRLAVAVFVHSLEQAQAAAACAAEQGADLIEYRIDALPDLPDAPAIEVARKIVAQSPLPCILTCRGKREGGLFDGDESQRVSLLEAIAVSDHPPTYLDFELMDYRTSANVRQKVNLMVDHPGQVRRQQQTGLILSTHDFQGRPIDLIQRLQAIAQAPACRVAKVVWQARSLRDNLEAFEILRQKIKPTIALCMGPFGLPSRVLAKKFGALLTFVSLDGQSQTAPGQPTIRQIKTLYRWDKIGPQTKVYGVIGWPVAHSMSPQYHNGRFDAIGHDGVYLPMPIAPEYESFKATVGSWLDEPTLHFRGASVTIPHKENLLRFVAERGGTIDPLAQRIGAANTLTVGDDGSLHAGNSDYAAALDAVCDALGIQRGELAGMNVAVLGAGGAARAVVAGFAFYRASVTIFNRTIEKARQLAQAFNGQSGPVTARPMADLAGVRCQVLINCTPLGMHPNVEDCPLSTADSDAILLPGVVVFDTIYNPPRTKLLRLAQKAGCLTISGQEMFVRQAAAQSQGWTAAICSHSRSDDRSRCEDHGDGPRDR